MMYSTYKTRRIEPGQARLLSNWALTPDAVEYITEQNGEYRIQKNAVVGWLVYIGVNSPPDFSQSAYAFSAALPVTVAYPLPVSGIVTLQVAVRYRNSYGCISQNSRPRIFRLTPTGQMLADLPMPQGVVVVTRTNGNIRVFGQLPSFEIDTDSADKVRVWVSTSEVSLMDAYTHQGNRVGSPWEVSFGTYSPGTYNVAVAYYRTSDGVTSPPYYTTITFPEIPGSVSAVPSENITP